MAEQTTLGFGTKLHCGGTEITLAEDITPPNTSRADIETKHLQSSNMIKTYRAGWIEPGEVKAKVQYTDDQLDTLNDKLIAGTSETWKVTFADTSYVSGPAYVKGLNPTINGDGIAVIELTLKCAGEWTPTPAA